MQESTRLRSKKIRLQGKGATLKKYINPSFPHLLHGGDYNPEQWLSTPEVWEKDMELMQKAHCNEMTVGIFAWAFLEPQEGVFDFSILDEIFDKIYRNGGRVILATPSGARPRWLVEKYPEVMRMNERGERLHFRDRHNHCYTSPVYREKVQTINRLLAERYGKHPALFAWHISNEYNGECFCPLCQEGFREYLQNRYGDIQTLNEQYWSGFWSLRYDNFSQIEPPTHLTVQALGGLQVDWKRFVTRQTQAFMQAEIEPIKRICPQIPVTTNLMPWTSIDNWAMGEALDFVSWDNYPDWKDIPSGARFTAFWSDMFRSIKGKPFLLMESALGLVNWHTVNRLKRPKIDKLQALQTIVHGSDSSLYFQFRKGRGGVEKFHGAIVDHFGGEETRIFSVAKEIGKTLQKIDEVAGSIVKARVAILYDWENKWALQSAQGFDNRDRKYEQTCERYYTIFWKKSIEVDFVNTNSDLSKYDLVVAPMLYAVSQEMVEKIAKYVQEGGRFYATYMLGMVNENDLCYTGGLPAQKLKEVFGIWNEEIDSLYADERLKVFMQGKEYVGLDYCEHIHLRGAKSLAVVDGDFGQFPALTVCAYGQGKAYYQAFRDDGEFARAALEAILQDVSIVGNLPIEREGVIAHTRWAEDVEYLFLENYTPNEVEVPLKGRYWDIEEEKSQTAVALEGYTVKVLKRAKSG